MALLNLSKAAASVQGVDSEGIRVEGVLRQVVRGKLGHLVPIFWYILSLEVIELVLLRGLSHFYMSPDERHNGSMDFVHIRMLAVIIVVMKYFLSFILTISFCVVSYSQEVDYGIHFNRLERLADSVSIEVCTSKKKDVVESYGRNYYPLSQRGWGTNSLYYEKLNLTFYYDEDEIIFMITIGEKAKAVYYQESKNIVLGVTEFRYIILDNESIKGDWSTSQGSMKDTYSFADISFDIPRKTPYDTNAPKVTDQLEQMKSPVVSISLKCKERHPNTKDSY
ncbi:hypothetical protein IMPERIA89_420029 [Imperialibacter sp. 89]|nr:hypothetical protein IMPERIA89_420029 [Imperialibacter sp. 89]CAD5295287.1 hypothetical protein IMPERIA75_690028 [Imperialibacter sp. 75]